VDPGRGGQAQHADRPESACLSLCVYWRQIARGIVGRSPAKDYEATVLVAAISKRLL
jgi:hypothetical protein